MMFPGDGPDDPKVRTAVAIFVFLLVMILLVTQVVVAVNP